MIILSRFFILITLLLLILQACSNPIGIGPEEEVQEGLFTLKVTKGGNIASNAEVFALNADNTLKDSLRTNSFGTLTYDPDDGELPKKLLVRTSGYTIGILDITTSPTDTLLLNLEPAQEKSIYMVIRNSYAEIAFTVGIMVEGFMIDSLYSQSAQLKLSYGLPEENAEIILLNPKIPFTTQSSRYELMVDDLQGFRKVKLTSILKDTAIPDGTRLYNGQNENGFAVMPDGWVWYQLNPAQGNENNQQFEVHGVDFNRIEFTSFDLQRYQNYFFLILPIFDSQTTYTPLFEVNIGTQWKFDVTNSSFFSGVSRSSNYELTWDFEEIVTANDQIQYKITESAIGSSTGLGGGPINATNSIIVTENEYGMWYYSSSSDRSTYSIPLSNFQQNFIEQQQVSPQKSILVTQKNGNEYNTLYSQIGRLAPDDVSSYANSFQLNKFEVNSNGLMRIESRTGAGHNFNSSVVTRIL